MFIMYKFGTPTLRTSDHSRAAGAPGQGKAMREDWRERGLLCEWTHCLQQTPSPAPPCRAHNPILCSLPVRFFLFPAALCLHGVTQPAACRSPFRITSCTAPQLGPLPWSTGNRQAGCSMAKASRTSTGVSLLGNTWSPVDTHWRPMREVNNGGLGGALAFNFYVPLPLGLQSLWLWHKLQVETLEKNHVI